MAVRTHAVARSTTGTAGPSPAAVARTLALQRPDPWWVDARPFRAHLRHLMSAGGLSVPEVAVVLGLSTRAVVSLLDGRAGRPTRRVSPQTARCLLRVSAAEVRGLRWCVTPPASAVAARNRLLAQGWSADEIATGVGFEMAEVAALGSSPRCNRLLAVRIVGLARALPTTIDDQHLAQLARVA